MTVGITPQLRQQGIVRFDFLGGCLPGRANPTDIDQALERNGHFLFIECKRPHQQPTLGQSIFFDRLVAGPRSVRLLVVQGDPPYDITSYALWGEKPKEASVEDVRTYVRAWYDWASQAVA